MTVERTVRELGGQPCIAFEDSPPAKKEIASDAHRSDLMTAMDLLNIRYGRGTIAVQAPQRGWAKDVGGEGGTEDARLHDLLAEYANRSRLDSRRAGLDF